MSEGTCCASAVRDCAAHPHALAIGSLSHVTVMDVRAPHAAAGVDAHDGGAGVRSLSLRGHVLTVGAADGRISFLDMRTRTYLPMPHAMARGGAAAAAGACEDHVTVSVGGGRFYGRVQEAASAAAEYDLALKQAVFCHAWDARGSRLATAGGPLLAGTRGCYAAVWG